MPGHADAAYVGRPRNPTQRKIQGHRQDMKENRSISRTIAAVPGFIIGILWLAMAAAVIWTSARGYANDRSDWGLGWAIVGFFLTAAGLSALIGTWWHNFRVKRNQH